MTLSKYIGDLLLQRTLGKPDHTQVKEHDNTVAFMDVQLHATNQQNKHNPSQRMLLCYFGEPWTYPGMPDQTHQILQDLTKASIISNYMQKRT